MSKVTEVCQLVTGCGYGDGGRTLREWYARELITPSSTCRRELRVRGDTSGSALSMNSGRCLSSVTSVSCVIRARGVVITVRRSGAYASGGVSAVTAGSGASLLKQTVQRARVCAVVGGPHTEQKVSRGWASCRRSQSGQ